MVLQVVSYLAPNWFEFYYAVTAYLERSLQVETELVQGACDPLADPMVLNDRLDLAFICGLPFIRYCQTLPGQLQAIVAPVMGATRYQNRPIYFSDVIVNAASGLKNFSQLAGKTVCYNDPGSNSGYYLLGRRLLQENYSGRFFGHSIQSGSHQRSVQWVIEGKADCAAIDSTVLEQELQLSPQLAHHLHVIESLGSCPMPPIVIAQRLGKDLIGHIQMLLLKPDLELQSAMQQMGVKRYAIVQTGDYNVLISATQVPSL